MTEEYKKLDLSKNEMSLLISCLQASIASLNRYIEENIQGYLEKLKQLSYPDCKTDRINILTDIIDSIYKENMIKCLKQQNYDVYE